MKLPDRNLYKNDMYFKTVFTSLCWPYSAMQYGINFNEACINKLALKKIMGFKIDIDD